MNPISQIGDQMKANNEFAIQQRVQVSDAQATSSSRRSEEEAAAERARQRRAEETPKATGGQLDTYA